MKGLSLIVTRLPGELKNTHAYCKEIRTWYRNRTIQQLGPGNGCNGCQVLNKNSSLARAATERSEYPLGCQEGESAHLGQISYRSSTYHYLDISRQIDRSLICMIYTAHGVGWDPPNLHDRRSTRSLGWICTMQILHSLSPR